MDKAAKAIKKKRAGRYLLLAAANPIAAYTTVTTKPIDARTGASRKQQACFDPIR